MGEGFKTSTPQSAGQGSKVISFIESSLEIRVGVSSSRFEFQSAKSIE